MKWLLTENTKSFEKSLIEIWSWLIIQITEIFVRLKVNYMVEWRTYMEIQDNATVSSGHWCYWKRCIASIPNQVILAFELLKFKSTMDVHLTTRCWVTANIYVKSFWGKIANILTVENNDIPWPIMEIRFENREYITAVNRIYSRRLEKESGGI